MGTLELLQVPFKPTKKDQKVCCLKDIEGQQKGSRMAEAGRGPVRGHLGASRDPAAPQPSIVCVPEPVVGCAGFQQGAVSKYNFTAGPEPELA